MVIQNIFKGVRLQVIGAALITMVPFYIAILARNEGGPTHPMNSFQIFLGFTFAVSGVVFNDAKSNNEIHARMCLAWFFLTFVAFLGFSIVGMFDDKIFSTSAQVAIFWRGCIVCIPAIQTATTLLMLPIFERTITNP